MKEIKIFVLILLSTCLLVGCEKKEEIEIEGEKIDTKEMVHEHCTRAATAGSGIDVSLNYDIYYQEDHLLLLQSNETITTTDQSTLDTYEDAYRGIHENYQDLEYYDTSLERSQNSVTSKMTIYYDKIDIEKLIEIEGEEDNIFENKVPLVSKWKAFAKKVGTKCQKVSQ